ncbi:DUF2280 domain-containing protein [Edwardsiella tarda]
MAALKPEVKAFIVQQLACFDTPSQIVEAVQNEFGIKITRKQVFQYSPSNVAATKPYDHLGASPAFYSYINDNLYVASISIRSETTFSVDTRVDTSRLDTSASSTMRGAIHRHREACRWWAERVEQTIFKRVSCRILTIWTEKGAARMSKIVDTDEA